MSYEFSKSKIAQEERAKWVKEAVSLHDMALANSTLRDSSKINDLEKWKASKTIIDVEFEVVTMFSPWVPITKAERVS